MRASWYAKALHALTLSGDIPPEEIVTRFVGTVSINGHAHMLHKILRAYERILAARAKHETIVVTTALPITEPDVATLLRREPFAKLVSGNHRRVERRVDPTIIGGAIVRSSTTRVDGSHKQKLLDIYQSLTS